MTNELKLGISSKRQKAFWPFVLHTYTVPNMKSIEAGLLINNHHCTLVTACENNFKIGNEHTAMLLCIYRGFVMYFKKDGPFYIFIKTEKAFGFKGQSPKISLSL